MTDQVVQKFGSIKIVIQVKATAVPQWPMKTMIQRIKPSQNIMVNLECSILLLGLLYLSVRSTY